MENQQPTTRNSIVVVSLLVLLSVLTIIGYWIYQDKIYHQMYYSWKTLSPIAALNSDKQSSPVAETAQNNHVNYEPNEHARKKIQETKELVGSIIEIVDPVKQDIPIRVLTIQSDIIDQNKLSGIDFNKPQNDLPLVRKEFKVTVTGETKIENSGIMKLKPGEFIYVSTKESIYKTTDLVALEIKVIRTSD